ncbi:NAD-dependent epimerase/dehydratase family protein [SAR202 cluster bacterium AD-804-J14_MRT_500m]|nr:NAD-dependent epimerase/dehydratase family protein [SAR202 cluster bacterium AD-804-J14_MRT_500m]
MVDNPPPPVIAVTGSSGYIGSRLLQQLENVESIAKLIAIDIKPLPMPFHNIDAYRLDLAQPIDQVFHKHKISTVVHLAFDMRAGRTAQESLAIDKKNIASLENVLMACHTFSVQHLIYTSSHTVYGAHPDNHVPIMEDTKLKPLQGFQYSQTKAASEFLLRSFAHENPAISVTILRSSMVLGPAAVNYVSKGFQKPFLLRVLGYDPPLQVIHEDDLTAILMRFSMDPRPGIFNVAGDGYLNYTRFAKILEKPLIPLPSIIAYPLTELAWKLGIQKDSPSIGLNLIRYPIILSTEKLKQETGFKFSYTSEEAVASYIAGV